MVQQHGWPEAKDAMKDGLGRRRIVKKGRNIWLLKCKPSCWRLYFYVWENKGDKRIIYVLAVCKQRDEEDPNDAAEAQRIFEDIAARRSAITQFEFPS